MHERHTNKEKYFKEQSYTTTEFVIPYISAYRPVESSMKVLEIGCGEGGNMIPFLELGCEVTGVDISSARIELARQFLGALTFPRSPVLVAEDIYDCDGKLNGPFDLIIMRDVIEHIHDQERFMGFVKRFLKPDGMFFLGFPPWYNPFGGHQQVSTSKVLSRLPYFHLLPSGIYRSILKLFGETDVRIEGFLEIKETGISIERFRRILKKEEYVVINETMYLFNPNYYIKFGLKPKIQLQFISRLWFLRNFLTTACYYLIKKNE